MSEEENAPSQQPELRTEIIEAQKARAELLKRKLEITAVLAAAGLGLDKTTHLPDAPLVLCCIPFVCLYVDLLCAHLNLRMMVIGQYLRTIKTDAGSGYEQFVELARGMGKNENKSAFDLETWANSGASIVLSVTVVVVAMFQNSALKNGALARAIWPYCASALIGIVMTYMVQRTSESRRSMLRDLGQTYESAVIPNTARQTEPAERSGHTIGKVD